MSEVMTMAPAAETQAAPTQRGLARAGWCLAGVVIVAFLAPRSVVPGGYSDGLLYASAARNLALGIGDWWHPHYTDTVHPSFHEHPPLMMIACSLLFRLVGDHFWTEKLFSALVLAIGVAGLSWLWPRRGGLAPFAWTAPLLWILFPLTPWLAVNHMLELPVEVCAILAAGCIVRGNDDRRWPAWYAAAAAALVIGFLVKGPFALFPLAMPALIAAPYGWRPLLNGVWRSAVLIAAFVVLLGICLLHDGLRGNLAQYWHQQVEASLSGRRGTRAEGRSHFLAMMIKENIVVVVPALAAALAIARGRIRTLRPAMQPALGWMLVGLSGCLPLLLSPRYATHYIGCSQAFFALAVGLPLASALAEAAQRWPRRWHERCPALVGWSTAAAFATLIAIGAALYGRTERDQPSFAEVAALRPFLERGEVIGAAADLRREDKRPGSFDNRLHGYLQRYLLVSVDTKEHRAEHRHYLADADGAKPDGAELLVAIPETGRVLYRLR